jgi:hypothetical protein
VIERDARIELIDVKGEDADVRSEVSREASRLARSLAVTRTRRSSEASCCAYVSAKTTSSAGASEVIRSGCVDGDRDETPEALDGRKYEIGIMPKALALPEAKNEQRVAFGQQTDAE